MVLFASEKTPGWLNHRRLDFGLVDTDINCVGAPGGKALFLVMHTHQHHGKSRIEA